MNQIERLDHSLNPITEPTRYTLPQAKITVDLPTRSELNAMRIQDQMVVNIVDAAKWERPVYFAVTVSEDNLMGLSPYLQMEGLVYRVLPHTVAESDRLDIGRTLFLIDKVYRFGGLGDGTTPLNDTSEKLLTNYAATYIQLSLQLRKPLLEKKAALDRLKSKLPADSQAIMEAQRKAYRDTVAIVVNKLHQCISLIPWDWRPRALLHELLLAHDRAPEAEEKMRQALAIEPGNAEYLRMLAQALESQGKMQEASELMRQMMEKNIDSWETFLAAAQNYVQLGSIDSAIMVMEQFASFNPGDRRAASVIAQIQKLKQQREQVTATVSK
jgi:tetratricopeptide (TPR) repeat protein